MLTEALCDKIELIDMFILGEYLFLIRSKNSACIKRFDDIKISCIYLLTHGSPVIKLKLKICLFLVNICF
jgi:hypothetical protein